MKKLLPILLLAGSASLLSFYSLNFHMRSGGSPGGNTGAPGQFGGRTCANQACHSGSAVFQANMISSDIPASGFIPGQSYTITGTVSEPGRTKFGFEISPQDSLGNIIGSINLINTTSTKFTNQNKSVTHTSNGNTGISGFRTWSFSWTAPNDGTENTTFWGAFNASNSDNSSSGDIIYRSLLYVEADTGSISSTEKTFSKDVYIYPNPIEDHFFVSIPEKSNDNMDLKIYSNSGKLLKTQFLKNGLQNIRVDASELAHGTYFIQLTSTKDGNILRKRILKY